MADVFEENLKRSHETLSKDPQIGDKVDVSPERRFIGFDGYRNAMDSMKAGDIVILTTPVAFRWPMFEYAVEKGLHVLHGKTVTTDGFTARKLLEINKKAVEKNLKVGVGLMCRHCKAGTSSRSASMTVRSATSPSSAATGCRAGRHLLHSEERHGDERADVPDQELPQLPLAQRRFLQRLLHPRHRRDVHDQGGFPDRGEGGGRSPLQDDGAERQGPRRGRQNFDSYGVEYTFKDGTKAIYEGRNMTGCHQEFAAYAHGTKGSAVISSASHTPAKSRLYKDQNIAMNPRGTPANLLWAFPTGDRGANLEGNPYEIEWEVLINAIREDKPHNEVERGVAASNVTSMGRMAAHTGQVITYDQMLNSEFVMAANVKDLTLDSDSPLMPDADGKYPVPEPGIKKDREY